MDLVDFVSGCFTNPIRRQLIELWSFLVAVSVSWCYVSRYLGLATTEKRKLFHFLISAVYVSGIRYDVEFLCIAAAAVFVAFVLAEVIISYT